MTPESTTTVDAIYRNGSFTPLTPITLGENERVRLQVQRTDEVSQAPVRSYLNPQAIPLNLWISAVRKRHADFIAKHGFLPDSAADIAQERMRDV